MAYDRYDPRDRSRDERSRWSDDRFTGRDRPTTGDWRGERGGHPDERGFFDRASDEVASWFGDDEAERRRREDRMRDEREGFRGARPSDYNRERGSDRNRDRDRGDWNDNRGAFAAGGSSEEDYNRGWRGELFGGGREQNRFRDRGRDYRPMAGD